MDAQPTWSFASLPDDQSTGQPHAEPAEPSACGNQTSVSPQDTAAKHGLPTEHSPKTTAPKCEAADDAQRSAGDEPTSSTQQEFKPEPQSRRFYGPRTCRICLETEEPKFPTDVPTALGIATASSKPSYVSDDPDLGRLLSPCKCKGSQKYVHEGCLDAWRTANPTAARNFWQCPTCKFTYRMTRLRWASMLSSKITQVALTLLVFVSCIYVLGWIADPILDLWFDPVGTIGDTVSSVIRDVDAQEPILHTEPSTWDEHFLKGFLSLGIIGFFKSVLIMTPWDWLNLRGTGMYYRARRGGRARTDNINMILVLIGAITFLGGVWKVVKALSTRVLKSVSDRVLDVEQDDEEEQEAENVAESRKDQ